MMEAYNACLYHRACLGYLGIAKELPHKLIEKLVGIAAGTTGGVLHNMGGVKLRSRREAAAGLWTVFTLGGVGSKASAQLEQCSPLASQSLLLLLVLANLTDTPDTPNPYRQAIMSFKNTQGSGALLELIWEDNLSFLVQLKLYETLLWFMTIDNTAFSSSNPHAFQINFNSLYTALCEQQRSDQATLLLYMLLHQNSNVRTYVLARTDIENLVSLALPPLFSSRGTALQAWVSPAASGLSSALGTIERHGKNESLEVDSHHLEMWEKNRKVLPILEILYHVEERNSHHVYMALIILLILTEDDGFNRSIHEVILKNITWYAERVLTEISLGSLLILVVIRTIQYNMTRTRFIEYGSFKTFIQASISSSVEKKVP
ncbi:hypothetical protein DV515_00013415 [Chloebia gouldiae]|uniref:Dymeclin n=1 Tax=Chloebia gouldiae TaxID=44316 RepID=A0A3L8S2B3_CHLGU|nr:hypothetical protein DV515_00013415 [Chloebia gouldiae]